MLEVALREIEAGAESLRKLADNAKMSPTLFIRFANAWRDVKEQLDVLGQVQAASLGAHTQFSEVRLADGSTTTVEQFIDGGHKREHLQAMQQARDSKVALPRCKPISWEMIEAARSAKDSPLEITAFDVASLAWLIDLPEE